MAKEKNLGRVTENESGVQGQYKNWFLDWFCNGFCGFYFCQNIFVLGIDKFGDLV